MSHDDTRKCWFRKSFYTPFKVCPIAKEVEMEWLNYGASLMPKTGWTRCVVNAYVPEDGDFIDGGWEEDVIYFTSRMDADYLKIALKQHFSMTEVTKWSIVSYEECGPLVDRFLHTILKSDGTFNEEDYDSPLAEADRTLDKSYYGLDAVKLSSIIS